MDDAWWLQHIFGRSLADEANPAAATLAADASPCGALAFMARLFSDCGRLLAPFTDRQVAEGLVFLAAAGECDWMCLLYDPSIDRAARFDCARSIEAVYRDCFARRLPNRPRAPSSDLKALDSVCFMWWDRFPSGGLPTTTDDEREAVYFALIDVMAAALQIDHAACQESALHGLGHFGGPEAPRAQAAIDAWLAEHADSPLRAYAEAAREGNVL